MNKPARKNGSQIIKRVQEICQNYAGRASHVQNCGSQHTLQTGYIVFAFKKRPRYRRERAFQPVSE